MKKIFAFLGDPFRSGNRISFSIVLVFSFINGLVLVNACLHDPRIGYDANNHLRYMQALSELRLVTISDSSQFYSPPLPHFFPSLLMALTGIQLFWAAKFAQILNVLLSLGLSFYLLKICDLISSRPTLKLGSLMFLGILPVYYKSFAFIRGEPYVAFLGVVIVYYAGLMCIRKSYTMRNTLVLGTAMGLCALSRQFGILLLAAVFLFLGYQWLRYHAQRHVIAKTFCICLLLISIISGWFYLSLKFRYGAYAAYNREPAPSISLKNYPVEFYIGLSPSLLFSKPVRPNIPNQLFPIFYSEIWGDYWNFFTVYGIDTRKSRFVSGEKISQILSGDNRPAWFKTNYDTISNYLGRVNLVSILPTTLAFMGIFFSVFQVVRRARHSVVLYPKEIPGLILVSVMTSLAGYFWFLIMFTRSGEIKAIKATYLLQIFPFIALMVGIFLFHVYQRSQFLYWLILGGLLMCCFHNIPAMLTHYSWLRLLMF